MYRSTRMRVVWVRRGQFSHQSACIHARVSLSCVHAENLALAAMYVHIVTRLSVVCTLTGAHVWPQLTSLFTCRCCCCSPRTVPTSICSYMCVVCCVLQESSSDVSLYLCLHEFWVLCFSRVQLWCQFISMPTCVLCSSGVQLWRQLISIPTFVLCIVFFKSPALTSAYIYAYMCVVFFKSPALTSAYIYT